MFYALFRYRKAQTFQHHYPRQPLHWRYLLNYNSFSQEDSSTLWIGLHILHPPFSSNPANSNGGPIKLYRVYRDHCHLLAAFENKSFNCNPKVCFIEQWRAIKLSNSNFGTSSWRIRKLPLTLTTIPSSQRSVWFTWIQSAKLAISLKLVPVNKSY